MRSRVGRKLQAVRPSKAAEMWYRAALLMIVDHLIRAGAEVANELRSAWPIVNDSPPDLDAIIARAARKFGNIHVTAKRLADIAALRNLDEVDERLAKAIRTSVGVDVAGVLTKHGKIAEAMRSATQENVDLIVSIPAQYLDKVRAAVQVNYAEGLRWEALVERIQEIGDVTKSRAKLIARDQTAKLNSSFNEARQTGLGITRYRWSGSLDRRERPSHVRMEGKICRWDSPPVVDGEHVHPGMAIQCRCVATPMVDIDQIPDESVAA